MGQSFVFVDVMDVDEDDDDDDDVDDDDDDDDDDSTSQEVESHFSLVHTCIYVLFVEKYDLFAFVSLSSCC